MEQIEGLACHGYNLNPDTLHCLHDQEYLARVSCAIDGRRHKYGPSFSQDQTTLAEA